MVGKSFKEHCVNLDVQLEPEAFEIREQHAFRTSQLDDCTNGSQMQPVGGYSYVIAQAMDTTKFQKSFI